jgi:hypothetical protein
MRFQEGLLDDVGSVHAHLNPLTEPTFGQAVQGRPLGLQQSAQRFPVAPAGLLQQLVCANSVVLHRRTPKERARKQPPLGARVPNNLGAGE